MMCVGRERQYRHGKVSFLQAAYLSESLAVPPTLLQSSSALQSDLSGLYIVHVTYSGHTHTHTNNN